MTSTVLIVEDEVLLRIHAVDFMEQFGFAVYAARNADAAVVLLERHDDIRALFTDINMPGSMDGLMLAHYVHGRWPPLHLIITSGLASPRTEDMPLGSEFVGKPYQLEKVTNRLRVMIG
jgi:two-component system, response regulator PdtaR